MFIILNIILYLLVNIEYSLMDLISEFIKNNNVYLLFKILRYLVYIILYEIWSYLVIRFTRSLSILLLFIILLISFLKYYIKLV